MLIAIIASGFGIGLLGSLHCVGMCGPLALALPTGRMIQIDRILAIIFYNSGRAITYALMGTLIGIAGRSVAFFWAQQWVSVLSGVLILFYFISNYTSFQIHFKPFRQIQESIKNGIGRHIHSRLNAPSYFIVGLLNGLLPCGLVYVAIAAALSAGSIAASTAFMFAFGLGTMPAMMTLMLLKGRLKPILSTSFNKVLPTFLIIVGVLLVLRGSGLEIPFVSPKSVKESNLSRISTCH
jgi:sulfite exporter TauE/SafE